MNPMFGRFRCQKPTAEVTVLGLLTLGPQEEHPKKEVFALADGIVKWFSDNKGYGFIEQENGPDIFVHFPVLMPTGLGPSPRGSK